MRHPCIDAVFDVPPVFCSKAARTLCLGVSLWMGFSSIALAESLPQWLVTATLIDGTTDAVIAGLPATIDFTGTELSIRYQPTSAMFATATLEKREGSKAVLGVVTLDAQSLELGWTHQFDPANLSGLQLKASFSAIRRHNEVTLSGLGLALASDENRLRLRMEAELDPHWRLGVASSVRASGDPRARSNVIYLGRMLTERVFLAVRYQDSMSSIGTNYAAVTEEYALTLGTRF